MPIARQVVKVRRAISPRLATSSRRIIGGAPQSRSTASSSHPTASSSHPTASSSHPEHAEVGGALDWCAVDRGQADAQDGASVAGVDDTVVVEPAGQIERVRLLLYLVRD